MDFPELNKEIGPSSVSIATSSLGIMSQSLELSTEVEGLERKFDKSVESEMSKLLDESSVRHKYMDGGTSHKAFQEKDHLGHGDVDASESIKLQKDEMRSNSNQLEVDEFGRLPRAGAIDSDSDELHYKRRQSRRGRSRSRSRSPHSWRRSPLRRREKLSQSPSNFNQLEVDEFGRLPRAGASDSDSDELHYKRRQSRRGRSRSRSPHDRGRRSLLRRREKLIRSPSNSYQLEFDEFGRLPRAGASDSDSDELRYKRRQSRRGQSRSRSRSPHDRRRRSPLRRREKLSRSPRNRRSRSRSPSYRRGGEASADRIRRERGQLPDCFDFLCWECFCGTSRRHKSKHQCQDFLPRMKSTEKSVHQHDETNRQDINYQDVPGSGADTMKDEDAKQDAIEHEIAQRLAFQEQETGDIQEDPVEPANNLTETASSLENILLFTDSDGKKLVSDISERTTSFGHLTDQLSQPNPSIPSQLPVNEPLDSQQTSLIQSDPNTGPLSNIHSTECMTSPELPPNIPAYLPHPQLPLPPVSQSPNAPIPQQLLSDYNNVPSSGVKYLSHSTSGESFIPYQTSMTYQHSLFSIPPPSSWIFLPRTFPIDYSMTQQFGGSSLTGENINRPPLQGLISSNPFAHGNIQPYGLQGPAADNLSGTLGVSGDIYSRNSSEYIDKNQPSHLSDFGRSTFDQPLSTKFSSNILTQEKDASYSNKYSVRSNLSHAPLDGQGTSTLSSIIMTSSPNSAKDVAQTLPRPGDDLYDPMIDSFEPSSSSFKILIQDTLNSRIMTSSPNSARDVAQTLPRPGGDLYDPMIDSFELSSSSFKILIHDNLNSRIMTSSPNSARDVAQTLPRPGGDQYDPLFDSFEPPSSSLTIPIQDTLNSRIMTSSPNSARDVAQMLPRPSGDQYDPMFDSFEPSSSSFRRKLEATDNSDNILWFNSSNKPQDLDENNMQKEAGAIALSISAENDEFDETADGLVGAVKNVRPCSNPVDLEDLAAGDIEIEHVKDPGKIKKSKHSRSMKLFKVAIAGFVKEVLKPSWRQGNMSKEAFKTIVKKTVEKVSGAMKRRHLIPKSQAKINRYIDSSQRKLTKFVMGYVDKYVQS